MPCCDFREPLSVLGGKGGPHWFLPPSLLAEEWAKHLHPRGDHTGGDRLQLMFLAKILWKQYIFKKSKSILLKMDEIRLQILTYTVIKEETSTCLVLILQSSALHLEPSLGPHSLGRLSRRLHKGRFLAFLYTCGPVLC